MKVWAYPKITFGTVKNLTSNTKSGTVWVIKPRNSLGSMYSVTTLDGWKGDYNSLKN